MEYRTLGKTRLNVSEIGFGAWAIGGDAWGPVEDENSIKAMERALDLGINFIDTADIYGDGPCPISRSTKSVPWCAAR